LKKSRVRVYTKTISSRRSIMGKYPVILREVDGYNYERIRKVIHQGIEELGEKPQGKVFVKPNVIFAHKRYGQTGFTNPVFLRALL